MKIAWTLRSDPLGEARSILRTETRVMTTDVDARRKFRRYWSFFSPGIILIRWISLGPLKAEAAVFAVWYDSRNDLEFAALSPIRGVDVYTAVLMTHSRWRG